MIINRRRIVLQLLDHRSRIEVSHNLLRPLVIPYPQMFLGPLEKIADTTYAVGKLQLSCTLEFCSGKRKENVTDLNDGGEELGEHGVLLGMLVDPCLDSFAEGADGRYDGYHLHVATCSRDIGGERISKPRCIPRTEQM